MRPQDRAVHDWYRFVLSYPPHLVQDYLDRFGMGLSNTVLDPFCGTGTTPVECKKRRVGSVGIEPNPMAHFASSVKVAWEVDSSHFWIMPMWLRLGAKEVQREGINEWRDLPLFAGNGEPLVPLQGA